MRNRTRATTLSETMERAFIVAIFHGGLENRRGGFWTYPGCPVKAKTIDGYSVPTWYVSTTTMQALARRDAVRFTQRTKTGYPIFAEAIDTDAA